MILVDANLLLYAAFGTFRQHEAARDWLDRHLNGSNRVGLPWPSLLAFVRLATNPRMFEHPLSTEAAWGQVGQWLDNAAAWVPTPTPRHRTVLGQLLLATNATGNLVADAHLAALAIEHGLTLASADGDFARFPGLMWKNPLALTSPAHTPARAKNRAT